ncbi:gluconate:H+ symporter [Streptomyces sp. N35]|uniref:GntT/GntP/DsdX family permease n=1 Tax=Streptomyces sp. N35 TaxID=2795730 RepID=UPI0027DD2F46|nr:gluconate:H+ symporter [Streptomyces sp. N35]
MPPLAHSTLAAAAGAWTGHDTALALWALLSIAVAITLIIRFKVHPFLGLTAGTILLGFTAGLDTNKIVETFEKGLGSTLGSIASLVVLGSILGKLMADSGGTDRIVDRLLGRASPRAVPWIMTLVGALIGIPLFFEVGFVLMMPIIFAVSRRVGASPVRVAVPALAGLSVLHGLVPPHPGPLIAIEALHADLGRTLMLGLLIAVPTVIVAGPLYGNFIARHVNPQLPEPMVKEFLNRGRATNPPSFLTCIGTLLLPVVLMLFRTVVELTTAEGSTLRTVAAFVGAPLMAMLIAVTVAMFTFGVFRGTDAGRLGDLVSGAFGPIAGVTLIVGAGGGFKEMLVETGVGESIAKAAQASHIPAVLLAWLTAVAIRFATGSATVATVTAAGIMAPVLAQVGGADPSLVVLAIGAGSLFFSLNDAGIWLVKEYLGTSVVDTIKTWSVMETLISVMGLAGVMTLSLIL